MPQKVRGRDALVSLAEVPAREGLAAAHHEHAATGATQVARTIHLIPVALAQLACTAAAPDANSDWATGSVELGADNAVRLPDGGAVPDATVRPDAATADAADALADDTGAMPDHGIADAPTRADTGTDIADTGLARTPRRPTSGSSCSGHWADITPSVTSCTSPCAVLFEGYQRTDAPQPMRDVSFSWDFGDASEGSWKLGPKEAPRGSDEGPVVAHMFALPDGASVQSFSVRLEARRPGHTCASAEIVIRVAPFSEATACVSRDSGFGGCPSAALHDVRDEDAGTIVQDLLSQGYRRILFRRGHWWQVAADRPIALTEDGLQLGAFGPASRGQPQLRAEGIVFRANAGDRGLVRNLAIQDFDVVGVGPSAGPLLFTRSSSPPTRVERLVIQRVRATALPDGGVISGVPADNKDRPVRGLMQDQVFLFDNEWSDAKNYFIFGRFSRFGFVGNRFDLNQQKHVRIAHGELGIFAHNALFQGRHQASFTLRSDGHAFPSFGVSIRNNTISSQGQIGASLGQNNHSECHEDPRYCTRLQDVLFEDNLVSYDPDGLTSHGGTAIMAVPNQTPNVAERLTIRGNQITGPWRFGVSLQGDLRDVRALDNQCTGSQVDTCFRDISR